MWHPSRHFASPFPPELRVVVLCVADATKSSKKKPEIPGDVRFVQLCLSTGRCCCTDIVFKDITFLPSCEKVVFYSALICIQQGFKSNIGQNATSKNATIKQQRGRCQKSLSNLVNLVNGGKSNAGSDFMCLGGSAVSLVVSCASNEMRGCCDASKIKMSTNE